MLMKEMSLSLRDTKQCSYRLDSCGVEILRQQNKIKYPLSVVPSFIAPCATKDQKHTFISCVFLNFFNMKTLAELNSKWYWRLLKVIGFLLYTLVFIGSSVGIYFYFSHYNPIKLENAQHSIEEKSNISNSLEYIKKQLP